MKFDISMNFVFNIISTGVASCFGDWRWGLRVTPFMGLVSILLIIFFMIDPERGLSDGAQTMAPSESWKTDVKELANNKSFVLATMGFTCVTFSVGE
jgi:Na+/melibiose symporter-like transporter